MSTPATNKILQGLFNPPYHHHNDITTESKHWGSTVYPGSGAIRLQNDRRNALRNMPPSPALAPNTKVEYSWNPLDQKIRTVFFESRMVNTAVEPPVRVAISNH
jgi:hypothetical protein